MTKANIIIFAAVLSAFFVMTVVLPPDTRTVEIENRELNKLPELTAEALRGNSYTKGVEAFIADQVAFRSSFISFAKGFENAQGFTAENEAKLVLASGDIVGLAKAGQNNAPIKAGNLLLFTNRVMEIFAINRESAAEYGEVIKGYREALPDNVNIYSLLIPTQIEFLKDPKYAAMTDSQQEAIEIVNAVLPEGVTPVDCYSALSEHSGEYIYFRTDHHWTALGAFYAYEEYCKAAGIEPKALSDYESFRLEGFLGYLYNITPTENLKKAADIIYYYVLKEPVETSRKLIYLPNDDKVRYSVFIGGDSDYYKIATSVANGKTAIIIKDSYANCFVPFLAPHYQNIVVIDPRTFEGSVISESAKYEDVDLIFLNYVFTTTFADFIQMIDTIK